MTDKLTFSFQGPVKFRLGNTEIDLSKQSTEFNTARSGGKSEPLKGFQAADGTFFRLKKHASGDGVDVIVYGTPENLAKYQFKVKNGDLRKARFSDGAFGKDAGAAAAGSFKLKGSSLDGATRAKSLKTLGLTQLPLASPKQAGPSQVSKQAEQVDSSQHVQNHSASSKDPGSKVPAVDQKQANDAAIRNEAALEVEVNRKDALKAEIQKSGLRSDAEVADILSTTLENASGGDVNPRVKSYLEDLIAELTAGKNDVPKQVPSRKSAQEADRSIKSDEDIGGADNLKPIETSVEVRSAIGQLNIEAVRNALVQEHRVDSPTADPELVFALLSVKLGSEALACKEIDKVAKNNVRRDQGLQIAEANAQRLGEKTIVEAGLTPVVVKGDGHCWFASMAVALAEDGPAAGSVPADPFDAAMSVRTDILNRLVRMSDAQLEKIVGKQGSGSYIKDVAMQVARGINVGQVDSRAWGDFNTARVAAIVFERPVVMVDLSGKVSINHPDGRYEAATDPLATILTNPSDQQGAKPAVIYQQTGDHFNGVRLKQSAAQ
jgi:hypothetical protein